MENERPPYEFQVLTSSRGGVRDVVLHTHKGRRRLGGRYGRRNEVRQVLEILQATGRKEAVVFLGTGLGAGLRLLLKRSSVPVAVVDRETDLLAASKAGNGLVQANRVSWIDGATPGEAMKALNDWAGQHGLPVRLVRHPAYERLDPGFYGVLRRALAGDGILPVFAASGPTRVPRPSFSWPPRVLLLTSKYFLCGDAEAGCQRLGLPHRLLNLESREMDADWFVRLFIQAVEEFRPDFVLTMNHHGVDRQGMVLQLCARLGLPLASWFVDNPLLILPLYPDLDSRELALFTWDADTVEPVRRMGARSVHHLPLGVDQDRFKPPAGVSGPGEGVCFVGNSMVSKVARQLRQTRPPRDLLRRYREIGRAFAASSRREVEPFLATRFPDMLPILQGLEPERRLGCHALIMWEATRVYRQECVKGLLGADPLIVGDPWWKKVLGASDRWRWRPEVSYYSGLPGLYPACAVNFNTTSRQMKGAVNQRVFDVPACGGFLLTDGTRQLASLFEPGQEVAVYHEPEEVPEMVDHYLKNPSRRQAVAAAARRRVLAEHTYAHRMERLARVMTREFS
jgi:spore maturation protein CgeB